jgi:hypothetical protein
MQIDTNTAINANKVAAEAAARVVAPPKVTVPVGKIDTAAFNQSMDLQKELDNTADSRAEKVEKALDFIRLQQWPPVGVMQRIANLLSVGI